MDHTNSNLPSVTIDVGEKSHNVISPKPSVRSYATRVFQESTVGIVSSIFSTHSKYRRFFKVFLSSLCIAGFIYSCVVFMNHVFQYPEVMDFSLDRSKTYSWPAYTYCNNNPTPYLQINASFKRMMVHKFQHIPRFESIELFSYIGGYLGMWLGISLASLFDFGEMIYDIVQTCLKGKRNQKTEAHTEQLQHLTV